MEPTSRRATGSWRLAAASLAALAAVPFLYPSRPLTAPLPEAVEMKDLTWVEVRSALQAGYTTVIVPTGGIEQNGPHMILGKHDYLVAYAARQIAKEVGRTLVAPVVSYVPEGQYDPPTGHMRFPGTLGVPEPVFAGVLEGIARSLKVAGFKTIVFIGDHGQSQPVQAEVAQRLSLEWQKSGIRVVQADSYYAVPAQTKKLQAEGFGLDQIGQHASLIDTSELMAVNPKGVDIARYSRSFLPQEHNGVYGNPTRSSSAIGADLIRMRIEAAAGQIRALLGKDAGRS
jgi:creatinine amidohydrolase/Fe(II)-dependent formamide hydrolase-like protein